MHVNESNWIVENLEKFDNKEIDPVLDLGGSTLKYRTIDQSWLEKFFYSKLRDRKLKIFFSDIKEDIGVDFAGDIFDDQFIINLKKKEFKSIFCCNFLEHVLNPQDLINRCLSILPVGGILVITVPHSYPFHRDPIDTMFRPNIEQLAALISNHEIMSSEIIATGSYWDHLLKNPLKVFRHIRIFFPFLGFDKWKRSTIKLKWLFTNFKHTCMIIKKTYE
jgi:SAM-dependent methyltransferase